jgi:hypothetical protein
MEAVVPYEERLNRDKRWALMEGSMHFEKESAVQQALMRITRELERLQVPYAVAGGMALFYHGYRRFTEDVDIIVSKDSLKVIHDNLEGRGYLPPFEGSKNLRDTVAGVKVEFIVAGEFPGDGKPKSVSFPRPETVAVEIDGFKMIPLDKLIELKLASGISHPLRGKDVVDVQSLITVLNLGEELADQLDPYVRDKYLELVRLIRSNPQPPE